VQLSDEGSRVKFEGEHAHAATMHALTPTTHDHTPIMHARTANEQRLKDEIQKPQAQAPAHTLNNSQHTRVQPAQENSTGQRGTNKVCQEISC